MTYFWAYAAGLLTLINPCVLPLIPIIVATAFQDSRAGPLMLGAGLVLSFTAFGLGVTAFGHLAGLTPETLNTAAAALLMAGGVVLLVPRAQVAFAGMLSPLADRANASVDRMQASGRGAGAAGQFGIGVLLGAVWSPCIGPTLGGAIALAARGEHLGEAGVTMLAFGLGVASVLMALAYGSRELLQARRERMMALLPWAKPIMGGTLLVVGLAILFHIDRMIETLLLDLMPLWLIDLSVSV